MYPLAVSPQAVSKSDQAGIGAVDGGGGDSAASNEAEAARRMAIAAKRVIFLDVMGVAVRRAVHVVVVQRCGHAISPDC